MKESIKIPNYDIFIKKLELFFVDELDKVNDNFNLVPKYSKEYYLIRDVFLKNIPIILNKHINFYKMRNKTIRYKKYKNKLNNDTNRTIKDSN